MGALSGGADTDVNVRCRGIRPSRERLLGREPPAARATMGQMKATVALAYVKIPFLRSPQGGDERPVRLLFRVSVCTARDRPKRSGALTRLRRR
jgi:hypothetical protein